MIDDNLRTKFGGSCFFKGQSFYINASFFEKNNGLIGGALAISGGSYDVQDILIEESIFKENFSGNGGAFGITDNVQTLTMVIRKNFFIGNWAASEFFFN